MGFKPGSGIGRHSPQKNAVDIPGRMVAVQKGPPHLLWNDACTFAMSAARELPVMVRKVVASKQALA